MNKFLTFIGIAITVLYLSVLYVGVDDRINQITTMPLNELGDFFAGAFGPLAILWLILGFFQQGKELKQQAIELNQLVKQHEELVNIAEKNYEKNDEISNNSKKAKFIITNILFKGTIELVDIKFHKYIVKIKNVGQNATNITIGTDSKELKLSGGIKQHSCIKDSDFKITLLINYDFVYKPTEDRKYLPFEITYEDDYHKHNKALYVIFIKHNNISSIDFINTEFMLYPP